MANDDDERGRKDNAGKEHKPKDVGRYDHALSGSVGQARVSGLTPRLGLGGNTQRMRSAQDLEPSEQKIVFRKSQEQERTEDNRPLALDTEDHEVNADTDAKGERRISMEDIKREAGTDRSPEEEKAAAAQEKLREENRGVYAPITDVPEIDQKSRDDGYTLIPQDEFDQMKADRIRQKMDKDRGPEIGR
ncbi:MAG: hypothetical protein V2I43_24540 [Parvularcula sp.]|jgi:hypothetical protein|nr:hypothetical protein [Parvularcula sp.]